MFSESFLLERYEAFDNFHFHHSIVQGFNDGFYYKVIDGVVFVVKKTSMMGTMSLILYNTPLGYEGDYTEFLSRGFSVRNSLISGTPDPYGVEYVYDCDLAVSMEGPDWRRHRNVIRRYEPTYSLGYTFELDSVVDLWSAHNKSTHQKKLLKTVKSLQRRVTITRSYVGVQLVGFSVVELFNSRQGVILQRLINPEVTGISEPNVILHYNDCLQHAGAELNMGASMNISNMEFAKKKLNPVRVVQINRMKPTVRLLKEDFQKFGL